MALSTRDRDRLKVFSEAKKGLITQKQAADQLKLTERHVRRLAASIRQQEDRTVLHRLRGRPLNRRIPDEVRQQALAAL